MIKVQSSILLCMALSLTSNVTATIIYSDDFSGAGGALDGTAPDTAPGAETWTSNALFNDAGAKTVVGSAGAYLPFTPVALTHSVYQLSMDVDLENTTDNDWFALGFTAGNNTAIPLYAGSNQGVAWMLTRENGNNPQTFLGPVTGGSATHAAAGNGPLNLMVQLDTRQPQWRVTWHINGSVIRDTANTFTTNPTINYVGFGALTDATGTYDNFRLETVNLAVPEPGTAALMGLGLLLLQAIRKMRGRI